MTWTWKRRRYEVAAVDGEAIGYRRTRDDLTPMPLDLSAADTDEEISAQGFELQDVFELQDGPTPLVGYFQRGDEEALLVGLVPSGSKRRHRRARND